MLSSSLGQTYFIALFGASLRSEFILSDGDLGALYAAATFASAITLNRIGHWIDRTTVIRFTVIVAAMLASGCLLLAASPNLLSLGVGLYLLRLFGQGLMVHTALTATARAFSSDRGKALSFIALGLPLGEAALPLLAVQGIEAIGWRKVWLIGAAVLLALVATCIRLLSSSDKTASSPRTKHRHRVRENQIRQPHRIRPNDSPLWRDRRFLFAIPAIVASPFISTGFFFHQTRLAAEMGWPLSLIASCFVAYAAARVIALLGSGHMIDHWGSRAVLPYFLLPQGISLALVSVFERDWVAVPYFVLFGVSSAMASTLATALWVDLFGSTRLAKVRATVESINILATGASPLLLGFLIDAGVSLSHQALVCLVYILFASALARHLPRPEVSTTQTERV